MSAKRARSAGVAPRRYWGPVDGGSADDEVQQGGQPVVADSPELRGLAEVERRHDQLECALPRSGAPPLSSPPMKEIDDPHSRQDRADP